MEESAALQECSGKLYRGESYRPRQPEQTVLYQVVAALLFVGGVMNVLWIARISVLILLEKGVNTNRLVSRVSGALLRSRDS